MSEAIHVGDRLRIQPGNDRAGQGFTVRKMFLGKRPVKRAGVNSFVSIPLPVVKGKVYAGDLVFKLATGKSFTMSEEACLRRLHAAPVRSHGVQLYIECSEVSSSISIAASVAGLQVEKTYPVEMIPANKSPLHREALLKVFSHTGHPIVVLSELLCGELPPVVIKPSRLKKIRRDFYAHLKDLVEKELGKLEKNKIKEVTNAIVLPITVETEPAGESGGLYVVTNQLPDIQSLRGNPTLQHIIPLTAGLVADVQRVTIGEHDRSRIIWDLPAILFDCDWPAMQRLVETLVRAGFFSFRLNNISHFELFNHPEDFRLIAGSWLYTLNKGC